MRLVVLLSSILALALLVWVSVLLIEGKAPRKQVAWSETFCAQGAPAIKPNQQIKDGDLTVRFSNSANSCNQITRRQAQSTINLLQDNVAKLQDTGLPAAPRGRYITLTRNLPGDSLRAIDAIQINPYATGVSTLDINLTASPSQTTLLYGQADLILAEIAPGLSKQARARIAGTFTQLALNRPIEAVDSDGFDQSGSYELWLGRRFGGQFLVAAIDDCAKACAWPLVRNRALRAEGLNPRLLQKEWLDHFPKGRRVELLRQINSR